MTNATIIEHANRIAAKVFTPGEIKSISLVGEQVQIITHRREWVIVCPADSGFLIKVSFSLEKRFVSNDFTKRKYIKNTFTTSLKS